ncbi:MAG: hypothetical protein V7K26_20495 [Nostoc sp.]|uniref:hypothetical protein n=1 Tax=Nostoc sp. TaxID=1180 RepID=UPI002FF22C40
MGREINKCIDGYTSRKNYSKFLFTPPASPAHFTIISLFRVAPVKEAIASVFYFPSGKVPPSPASVDLQ